MIKCNAEDIIYIMTSLFYIVMTITLGLIGFSGINFLREFIKQMRKSWKEIYGYTQANF